MAYMWPLPASAPITQRFGANPGNGVNPIGGHTGIDIAAPEGTVVRAAGDGRIELADWVDDTWADNPLWLRGGIQVILNCGDTAPTFVYAHLSRTDRNAGDAVRMGDPIGYVGSTGYSSGPHVHFEALPPGYILNGPTLGRVDPGRYCSVYWGDTAYQGGGVKPILTPSRGIDISSHNRGFALSATGAGWVGVKVSEGIGWQDVLPGTYDWRNRVAEARAMGARVLFYHFGRPAPSNDPVKEAAWFAQLVKPVMRPGDDVALDWERHSRMVAGEDYANLGWARKWLDSIVEMLAPRLAVLYTYTNMIQELDMSPVRGDYPLWHAEYPNNTPQGWGPMPGITRTPVYWPAGVYGWQYTSQGRVGGYSGNLDLNAIYQTQEDDMPMSDADMDRLISRLLRAKPWDNSDLQVSHVLQKVDQLHNWLRPGKEGETWAGEVFAELAALRGELVGLAQQMQVDPAALAAALAESLAQGVDLSLTIKKKET